MSRDRPPIPADMKRRVRQRCGFGCVLCGLPVFDYDHIIDYSTVMEHTEENVTCLCDRHHREKTSGLIPLKNVIQANTNPHNLRRGQSEPYFLHFGQEDAVVELGNSLRIVQVAHDFAPVVVDGLPLIGFRFEDGNCLLQLRLYDNHDDLLLHIKDNELTYSTGHWDYEFVGNRLTLRSAPRQITFSLVFKPPNTITVEQGKLQYHGVEVEIWPDGVGVVNSAAFFGGFTLQGGSAFMNIGNGRPLHCFWQPTEMPRTGFDRVANYATLRVARRQQRELEQKFMEEHSEEERQKIREDIEGAQREYRDRVLAGLPGVPAQPEDVAGRYPRNAKCFCGSGHKFKRCHGRHPTADPLPPTPSQ